ncbi:uncharacterized protein LOC110119112 [Ceratitis capitata]|uniref:uncharacterized protein LOC110119112 n=1 Tax=Ceratitis capitata TaxID=7213 RepID=UPI000A106EC4|nr:uncharacterized protein LOC110119112 [Ceratitis capitata]
MEIPIHIFIASLERNVMDCVTISKGNMANAEEPANVIYIFGMDYCVFQYLGPLKYSQRENHQFLVEALMTTALNLSHLNSSLNSCHDDIFLQGHFVAHNC